MKIIALIPARAGSKRIASKNIRVLHGHPLIAYTIAAALKSEVFERVIVSTDSPEIAEIAKSYGAEVPFLRPVDLACDLSPDIDWVKDILIRLGQAGTGSDAFSLLRPTSPFRQATTIQRAWEQFQTLGPTIDSQRAIEKCRQHPGKMWRVSGNTMQPFVEGTCGDTPWHSSPYQSLPEVFVQNASLEIAWSRVPLLKNSIAGDRIAPFFTQNLEGFDINDQEDWWLAEKYAQEQPELLPKPQ